MQLPGVGEAIANAIHRTGPCQRVDYILRVPGIDEKRLAMLRPWFEVKH